MSLISPRTESRTIDSDRSRAWRRPARQPAAVRQRRRPRPFAQLRRNPGPHVSSGRPPSMNDAMKQEYDFSKGERGRFYHESAKLNLPVYLEEDVRRYLDERAESKGVDVTQLVNEMQRWSRVGCQVSNSRSVLGVIPAPTRRSKRPRIFQLRCLPSRGAGNRLSCSAAHDGESGVIPRFSIEYAYPSRALASSSITRIRSIAFALLVTSGSPERKLPGDLRPSQVAVPSGGDFASQVDDRRRGVSCLIHCTCSLSVRRDVTAASDPRFGRRASAPSAS